MRFGRSGRGSLFWGRGARTQNNQDAEFDPVASEERSALLDGEAEESPLSDADPGESVLGDPTQRLLTALGRFKRFVARAQDSQQSPKWAEDCMRQLVTAVEIAYGQGWKSVVRTLTDAARVLQSYHMAGEAPLCVPFLDDSYEILCSMLGDIIVGKTRSTCVDRWHQRYARALEDMAQAGIALVDDEGKPSDVPETPAEVNSKAYTEKPEAAQAPEASPAHEELESIFEEEPDRSDQLTPETAPLTNPLDMDEEPSAPDSDEPSPLSLDDLPDLDAFIEDESPLPSESTREEDEAHARAVQDARRKLDDLEGAVEAILDGLGSLATEQEADTTISQKPSIGASDANLEPLDFDAPEVEPPASAPQKLVEIDADSLPGHEEEPDSANSLTPLGQAVDALCAELSSLTEAHGSEVAPVISRIEECLGDIQENAGEIAMDGAVIPCLTMGRLVRLAGQRHDFLDQKFFELAYRFCRLYAEPTGPEPMQEWLADCETLIGHWAAISKKSREESKARAIAAAENPEPVVTVVPPAALDAIEPDKSADDQEPAPEQADPTRDLLATAQRAMLEGNAASAKLLAMRAAEQIAEAQIRKAEQLVEQAEERLRRATLETEEAYETVHHSDETVRQAEQQVKLGQERLDERAKAVSSLQIELDRVSAEIGGIEAEIHALQQQLEEAQRRHTETQTEYDKARQEKNISSGQLEMLREQEQQARITLEDARQRVTAVERRRADNAQAVEKAREFMAGQRQSLEGIQQTIEQIAKAESADNAAGGDDLLF